MQHQNYLKAWKEEKTTKIKAYIENGNPMQPRCFIVGYDFPAKTYHHAEFILDSGILEDARLKQDAYYWLHRHIRRAPFTPLAIMFMSPGKVNVFGGNDEDCWETVLYITYETEHLASFQIYRIINHVTESDEQPQRSLVYDHCLSMMEICDEMKIFLSLFHREMVEN